MAQEKTAPWYAEGLSFGCTQCGDCCRGEPGYVWVSQQEIAVIAAEMEMTPAGFMDEFVRRVGVRYSLKERPDGDGVLYEDGCKVYRVRPIQCRTFPFWLENIRSKAAWRQVKRVCPGVGRGKLYTRAEIEATLEAGPQALFAAGAQIQ